MRFRQSVVLGTMILAVCGAVAQAQECPVERQGPLALTSFDDLRTLAASFPTTKGEFETTADFMARQRNAALQIPDMVWTSLPLDLNHVIYNADEQAFQIYSFAVDNLNLNYRFVFADAGVGIDAASDNIDLVFPKEILSIGSYVGQNVYGAKRNVTRLSAVTRAIFDRPARRKETLFPRLRDAPAFNVSVPVDQAPTYRERLRAVVLVAPREPYYVEASDQTRVTMTGGRDEVGTYQIIVGDIRCIAITDDNHIVLQSRVTN